MSGDHMAISEAFAVVETFLARMLNGGPDWLRAQQGSGSGEKLWYLARGSKSATGKSLLLAYLNLAAVPDDEDPGDGPGPDDDTDEDEDDTDEPGFLAELDAPKGDAS